jgi:hypothetical protein
VAALLTGCAQAVPESSASASPTVTSASPTGSADVCADAAALQRSIAQLQDLDLVAEGTDAAKRDLQQVQQDLTRLVDSAQTQSAAVVARIESDIAAIQASLAGGAATPSAAAITDIRTQVSALDQDARTLIEEVTNGC